MRKALIVGIDYYKNVKCLQGCVNDAKSVSSVLNENADSSKNFDIRLMLASGEDKEITRKNLKDNIIELFKDDVDIALFYFSGHGHKENSIGYLITSDVTRGDDGFSMDELLGIVNSSSAKNKIIVLDCCFAGIAGTSPLTENKSLLCEGVTFLTSCANNQYSQETNGNGIFTTLFVDALNGSAANLIGDITPGSVYAHIDQALGLWKQRPIFKTNVKTFISLRKVKPPIDIADLKQIIILFPDRESSFKLDPSFEPERSKNENDDTNIPLPNFENNEKFKILQMYNRINLVVPVDAPHMWHAAMQYKSCKLTPLGCHYWQLVKDNRL
ncbi:MAG: caspase family protein [Termitinemataceae bacterium]|nr:MAG: caspase family protein [Termitinemataceae bacterium]